MGDKASIPAHLALSVWSEAGASQGPLSEVVLEVATGLIDTRRNFLMADSRVEKTAAFSGCANSERAWLRLEVRRATLCPDGRARMSIVAHLKSCETGATLWHAERAHYAATRDASLTALTKGIEEKFGVAAEPWVAPAFVTLQPLLEDMPDCHLTEEEILERIELGALPGPSIG